MRNQIKIYATLAMLSLPVSLFAANNDWYNPKSWFNKTSKKTSSTTVTGNVESIKDQIMFKTLDGQTLLLIGNKAAKVGESGTEAKIRVFGNVYKPSDKYPLGAIQVRNFRVLENGNTPVSSIITADDSKTATQPEYTEAEPVPEPYEEPVLESTPKVDNETPTETVIVATDNDNSTEVVVEEEQEEPETSKEVKTYVVQSGDTLGKISSKVFGTTTKWKKIAEANKITNPKHLKVGMTLNIPE